MSFVPVTHANAASLDELSNKISSEVQAVSSGIAADVPTEQFLKMAPNKSTVPENARNVTRGPRKSSKTKAKKPRRVRAPKKEGCAIGTQMAVAPTMA